MSNSKAKGGTYERDCAKKLSYWFSRGEDNNIFYRTGGSGNRGKLNTGVYNQYGDIMAVKEEGHSLMQNCVFECKKGYGKGNDKWDILVLIEGSVKSQFSEFLNEVYLDSYKQLQETGVDAWPVLIARRSGRKDIIAVPERMFRSLTEVYDLCSYVKVSVQGVPEDTVVMNLDYFFQVVEPEFFSELKLKR